MSLWRIFIFLKIYVYIFKNWNLLSPLNMWGLFFAISSAVKIYISLSFYLYLYPYQSLSQRASLFL